MTDNAASLPAWQTPALDQVTDPDATADRVAPIRNGTQSSQLI